MTTQPANGRRGDVTMAQETDSTDTTAADAAGSADARTEREQRRFRVQKLYIKDLSFESPAAPGIFSRDSSVDPKVSMQLDTESHPVGEDLHEVVLTVNVTSADDERTVFLVELKQAGVFEIAGFSEMDHAHALGSYCPGILFPFAREVIAGLVQKGGFPQVLLQPINFDAIFAQRMEQRQQQAQSAASAQAPDDTG